MAISRYSPAHSHLKRLGVNAVYTTPIFTAGSNHKYDTWDYLTIDPAFGTLDDFRGLLAELHTQDIRLILDAIFNHRAETDPDHFATWSSVAPASRYADWFVVDEDSIRLAPATRRAGARRFAQTQYDGRAYLLDIATHWMDGDRQLAAGRHPGKRT
ncbi:MAG: alpha-amylase family glycosyl hydrolase [Anaerolineae bacterium]